MTTLLTCPCNSSGKKASHYLASVFSFHHGKLLASLDPHRLGPHASITEGSTIPSLTAPQRHALQAVAESAARSELQLDLAKGDLLFFNNLALVHRRDAYLDGETSSRHMVRLWLRSQKLGWAIPDSLLPPWEAAYGKKSKVKTRSYPLVPATKYPNRRYTSGSAAFVIEDESDEGTDSE